MHRTYQTNHFVYPTDILYPNVWSPPNAATKGMWMPSFWYRVKFTISDSDAHVLVKMFKVY